MNQGTKSPTACNVLLAQTQERRRREETRREEDKGKGERSRDKRMTRGEERRGEERTGEESLFRQNMSPPDKGSHGNGDDETEDVHEATNEDKDGAEDKEG